MRIARFTVDNEIHFGAVQGAAGGETVTVLAGDPFYTGINPTQQRHDIADVRLLAPVIPRSKIVCVGRNYADHAAELGNELPTSPMLFFKPNTSVAGPGDPVTLPSWTEQVSYEAELAVVIGRMCKDVPVERVPEVVFGYTAANDLTGRDVQKTDGQWARAKGFDGACPLGPWIETDLDTSALAVRSRVNGETKQDGNTRDMVFDVPFLVSYVSQAFTLLPGDVILTGTPAGVGIVDEGDRIEVEVEGIGVLPTVLRR
ncbi:UNVERIFIED_CONTAM: fumarylacetoacetate hydrolase family protein [Kocuria sp. CPCC 205316]|uniref:fumarylacetoacetate hydrolase family protein n=1 Tax=Kocuria TaxID=57493 RepID=UPI0036DE97AC